MSTHRSISALRLAVLTIVSATLALTTLLGPQTAWACDEEIDPLVLQTARVRVEVEAFGFEQAQLRDWFQWMARTEKLLPAGYSLNATMWGELQLCRGEEGDCRTIHNSYDGYEVSQVFDATAKALGTPQKGIDWLKGMTFPTWTVQIASSPLYEGAHALADQLESDLGHMRVGHTGVGVFETQRGDQTVFKVFAGVYTSRADAEAALTDLGEEGHPGLVRRL